MIGKIMSSVVGARVVVGLAIAGLIGTATMAWAWQGAAEDAAEWKASAEEQRAIANRNADEAKRLAAERDQLDSILAQQRRKERKRREALEGRLSELRDALQADECANAAIPAGARERVFSAGAADADTGGGDGSSGGAE